MWISVQIQVSILMMLPQSRVFLREVLGKVSAGLCHDSLLRRLGSENLVIELFGLDSLILILGHDDANQRLVGRRTLKALDLLVKSLALFGLGLSVGSNRWICCTSSAGFSIYWLTANVIAILQSVFINKYFEKKEAKAKAQENIQ